MKKIFSKFKIILKKLILPISISFALVIISIVVLILTDDTPKAVPYNVKLELKDNSIIKIKENKLYDEYNKEFIVSDSKTLYNEFKPIEYYIHENYTFIVFSKEQEKLNNSMLVLSDINIEKPWQLYLIDNNSGNMVNIVFKDRDYIKRIKLDTIKFIDENMFIYEEYDLIENQMINIGCVKIINKHDLFDTISFSLSYLPYLQLLPTLRYEMTKDHLVVEYLHNGNSVLCIFTLNINFNYDTKLVNGKKVISDSSCSFYKKNIVDNYKDEKYLNDGYYAIYEDEVVYLSNDLSVKKLSTNKIIDTLENAEEFITKYM